MAQPEVLFDGVWKKFQRGERQDSLRDLIPSMAGRFFRRSEPEALAPEEFWALENVSFEARAGETLGIIGANGAGKSTSLKLLTRILRPTRGHCRLHGRVAALIEVAAGFHPDLTGRQNIYLQGAILQMTRREIDRKFDDIVDFAGIGEFVDTPVKRYSSGMNARLGFSIAAYVDPDVLLIDEVLSVGDAAFQARCLDRIRTLQRAGVVVVFVSHNLPAVQALCTQTLLLRRGKAAFLGDPQRAIELYLTPDGEPTKRSSSRAFERRGNGDVEIVGARLVDRNGVPVQRVPSGAPCAIEMDVVGVRGPRDVVVAFALQGPDRVHLFAENSAVAGQRLRLEAGQSVRCRIEIASLAVLEDRYTFTIAAHAPVTNEMYDWHESAYDLDVVAPNDRGRYGRLGLQTEWAIERVFASSRESDLCAVPVGGTP